jgi:hypothetical protein
VLICVPVIVGNRADLIYLHVMMLQRLAVMLLTGPNMAGTQSKLCSAWFCVMPLRIGDPASHVWSGPNVSGRTARTQCHCRNQELQRLAVRLPVCLRA